jgi:hypothetical protein
VPTSIFEQRHEPPNLDRDGYFNLLKKPGDAGGFADHKKEAKTKARGGRKDYAKDKNEKLAEANRLIDVERFSVRMAAKAISVDEKTLRNWREDTGHKDAEGADRPQ